MKNSAASGWSRASSAARTDYFSERLSPEERLELDSLKTSSYYPAECTLFVEEQVPVKVLFLLTGQVKLSLNSSAGRRVILGVACAGETLGLVAAFSGSRYDVTSETVSPCMIASIRSEDFLAFLKRHPSACVNVAREVCLEYARACEQVRRLGLAVTASAKLVRFLLDQCAVAPQSESGTRLFCALTHTEIGECIGVSRETVTRIFSDFRSRELLQSRGSTLIVSNRKALESYAGIE
jgi:CRP/FNR family cyclic AMP-dependent transcriptional regulator